MFRNYLAAALRNLVRNRLYAAINIIGLAAGFAAALLIALFVRDEFSYDKWIPDHENTYLVTFSLSAPGRPPQMGDSLPPDFAAHLKQDFSSITAVTRLYDEVVSLRHGTYEAREKIYWADANFFSVVALPVIAGDAAAALRRPDGLILTRAMARKYFGRDDPLGESLEINRGQTMTVAAVLEDLPSNTHLDVRIIASSLGSFSGLSRLDSQPMDIDSLQFRTFTYARIKSPEAARAVQDEMPAFFRRYRTIDPNVAKISLSFPILPLANIHLMPANFRPMKARGDLNVLYAISAAGILIVLLACINFVNLMTARVARRATEVGVRKTSGAQRRHLVAQFIGEAGLYMVAGVAAAFIAARLLLPTLNAFLDRTIAFDLWRHPAELAAAVVVLTGVSLLAGAYPAFVLSAFPPSVALTSRRNSSSLTAKVRQSLVMLQFAVLMSLLLVAGIVHRQINFATSEAMRLTTAQVVGIFTQCGGAYEDRVKALPGVRETTCTSPHALNIAMLTKTVIRGDVTDSTFNVAFVDADFFGFHGLQPVAGRFFSKTLETDIARDPKAPYAASVVLNETAVRGLGFASPSAAIGQTVVVGAPPASTIIGVVADFAFDSIRAPVESTGYFFSPATFQLLHVKLDGRQLPETLNAIDNLWTEVGEPRPINRFFLDQRVQAQYIDLIRQAQIFSIFSGVAVFIAALGLFGLSAFIAEQRTKEIGLRKALGASRLDIVRLLVWQFTQPVIWASAIAWPVSFFLMRRWLEGFAYHIDLQAWLFFATSGFAILIAVLTVSGHALLVARAQPVTALRYE